LVDPWSSLARTARPTGGGLGLTALVTTRGRRNVFQGNETETSPEAGWVGFASDT
jgi:hypothetical protein